MMKMRVRYSRDDKRAPKNTLATIRDGEVIYFGISRCNLKADKFVKQVGTHIAANRAELALGDEIGERVYVVDDNERNDIVLHKSGLRGSTHVDNIRGLIEYFNNIDEFSLRR